MLTVIFCILLKIIDIVQLITGSDQDTCEIACGAEPFFIVVATAVFIVFVFAALFEAILPSDPSPVDPTGALTNQLKVVLDSPMEHLVNTLMRRNTNSEVDDDGFDVDCNIKIFSCQNDALTAVMPF